jgi:hypothetical protein
VRNKRENRSNFDSLPRAKNLLLQYAIFVTWCFWCQSHVWKFSRPKDTHKNSYSSILGKRFSPLFLTTTPVGRFGMSLFFGGLLDLNFFHMCKQHRCVPTPKIPCGKKILQYLGGCQSWQLWNISYSYPLLVNLEYLFLNQSCSFDIWYTCFQHNNDFVSKISCINNNFLALGRVSKLAAVWALSLELHKVPILVSPHCT